MCSQEVECLDEHKLFIHNGINVISALAGQGKTTLMLKYCEIWQEQGYDIAYINSDQVKIAVDGVVNPPKTPKEFERMLELITANANDKTILIIDSLKAFTSSLNLDVQDNTNMMYLMQQLRDTLTTGITIILVHHAYMPKHLARKLLSLYGSRAIEEQSDSAFLLDRDEKTKNVIAKVVKNRAGLLRDVDVILESNVKFNFKSK
jgi:predicted ATP-dependent serine protease